MLIHYSSFSSDRAERVQATPAIIHFHTMYFNHMHCPPFYSSYLPTFLNKGSRAWTWCLVLVQQALYQLSYVHSSVPDFLRAEYVHLSHFALSTYLKTTPNSVLFLAIIYNVAVNIRIETSLWHIDFNSLGYVPRSSIVRSDANSIFSFLKNFHTVFCNYCINLHSHQQHNDFLSSIFLPIYHIFPITVILTDMSY